MSLLTWYSSIFTFLSLSFHCWSTAMHHTNATFHATHVSLYDHLCSTIPYTPHIISLVPHFTFDRWPRDLVALFLFLGLPSYPMHPVVSQPVTSHHTGWSGPYHLFCFTPGWSWSGGTPQGCQCARGSSLDSDTAGLDMARGNTQGVAVLSKTND